MKLEMQLKEENTDISKISGEATQISYEIAENYSEIGDKVKAFDFIDTNKGNYGTIAAKLDDSSVKNSSLLLSNDQAELEAKAKSDQRSDSVGKGSIIFFLFYDLVKLYHRLVESDEPFFPSKLPVKYIDENGKERVYQLEVMDYQLMIPLDEELQNLCLSKEIITNENCEWDEDTSLKWYFF